MDVVKAHPFHLWFKMFKNDKSHSGRKHNLNEELLKETIELDPHQNTKDLAQKLNVLS